MQIRVGRRNQIPGGVKITSAGDFSIQTYDGSGESRDDNQITI